MRAIEWMRLIPLIAILSTTSCADTITKSVITVAPKLEKYSAAFDDKHLAERKAIRDKKIPPCDRLEPTPPCSALLRVSNDYRTLRKQVKAGAHTGE